MVYHNDLIIATVTRCMSSISNTKSEGVWPWFPQEYQVFWAVRLLGLIG